MTAKPQCMAIVGTTSGHGAKHYSMQRIRVLGAKQCSRAAIEHVGHLHLCRTHARLAREGMIDETGNTGSAQSIRDARAYPKKFPYGLFTWYTKQHRGGS
ncbi:MAG TPA: hypothetical protein VFO62_00455 [Candidatus Binatia bacterium]|nr:hypothetical protein [Candidatus Binatia bacterium]